MNATAGGTQRTHGMRCLPGAELTMGSDRFYAEERPRRRVRVDPFWIDAAPVTNRQFAAFVASTGYRTCAEIAPDPADYPGMQPHMANAGSLVFEPPRTRTPMQGIHQWWTFSAGASWRHPLGPDSSNDMLADHPVVHVAYRDAEAYAAWAGKALPTEAEWEYAARGGLEDAEFAWGDEIAPGGAMLANYWQGEFPWHNLMLDGWERTSPVGAFAPNGFALFDMIGNVWEWTCDWFALPNRSGRQAAAFPPTPAVPARKRATTRTCRSASGARCSKAARICARRITAGAIGPRRAIRKLSIPRRAMSDFAASFASPGQGDQIRRPAPRAKFKPLFIEACALLP